MKIETNWPPNIDELRHTFPTDLPNHTPVFCYGDTLYNPTGGDIPADVERHEMVHAKQQGGRPEWWWKQYTYDPAFRLAQELEAFAVQYRFVKANTTAAIAKECLDDLAATLASPLYALNITQPQAATMIRKAVIE